ncbi:hypothetical protein [Mucilaginibacter defluvii]|uniref:hypothetical protein n=1 Tax=Mucilaginibacter defluvii TaxID=1196019 RepID=UPI0031F195F3
MAIKHLLKPGENNIEIKISSDDSRLKVSLYDTTFYDKYWIGLLVILILPLINLKSLRLDFITYVSCNIKYYRKYLVVGIAMLILLITLTILSYLVPDEPTIKVFIVIVFLGTFFFPAIIYVKEKMIHGKLTAVMYTFAIILLYCFLFRLPHDQYSYDINGHLEYVRYLINHGESPVATGGWLFYHPSLYYRIAALMYPVVNLANPYDDSEFGKYLQCLSGALFAVYYFFGLKTIDLYFKTPNLNSPENVRKHIFIITAAIFLFWPSNNFIGVRAGNDILFDTLFSVAFYFASKWWLTKQSLNLYIAIATCSLCVWAKTNGFIIYILLGFLLAIDLHRNRGVKNYVKQHKRQYVIFISAFLLTCYFSFHQKIEQWMIDPGTRLIVGNVNGLGANAIVQNKPLNYLFLNPVHFVETPFTDSFDDAKGRNYFWFFLLKSSMFGEFGFDDRTLQLIAQIMSLFLLTFIPLTVIWGLRACLKCYKYGSIAILANFATLLFMMIIFRIYYPYASSADFRYIFPFLLPLAFVLGAGFAIIKNKAIRFVYQCFIAGFLFAGLCFQLVFIF